MSRLKETEHLIDLNVFAAIARVLEGGCIYTSSGHRMAEKIVRMCIDEQNRQLIDHDRAKAKRERKL